MRTLRRGHTGNDVRYLQYLIGEKVDGIFGGDTEETFTNWQEAHGLDDDGKCGPLSRAKLGMTDYLVLVAKPDKVSFHGAPYTATYKPLKSIKEWAKDIDARYFFNLAFFNSTGAGSDKYGVIKGRTLTYVRGNGIDIGYGGTDEKIYVNGNNICSGYKLAVYKGKKKSLPVVGSRARNANGMLKDGRYIHIQSIGKVTESAIVSYAMKNYDIDTLLIQDAGGSTLFYDKKRDALLSPEIDGKNGRSIATVVAIRE